MATVRVGGVDIAYEQAGSGPVVVLVHAGLADRRMYDQPFQDLAADHRVIRYDWRGYGESGDAAGEISHHRDLLALLDALAVERAALVGCSMGGAYALDLALAAPHRVSALVLICSGLSGHRWPETAQPVIRRFIEPAVPPERLRAYRERRGPVREQDIAAMAEAQVRLMVVGPDREPSAMDPAAWRLALAMAEGVFRRLWTGPPVTELPADPPAVDRLDQVRAPTLVINGLADVPWLQALSRHLAARIPGARRLDLPDTGHLPPLERPAEVGAAVREFLRGAGLTGGPAAR